MRIETITIGYNAKILTGTQTHYAGQKILAVVDKGDRLLIKVESKNADPEPVEVKPEISDSTPSAAPPVEPAVPPAENPTEPEPPPSEPPQGDDEQTEPSDETAENE